MSRRSRRHHGKHRPAGRRENTYEPGVDVARRKGLKALLFKGVLMLAGAGLFAGAFFGGLFLLRRCAPVQVERPAKPLSIPLP